VGGRRGHVCSHRSSVTGDVHETGAPVCSWVIRFVSAEQRKSISNKFVNIVICATVLMPAVQTAGCKTWQIRGISERQGETKNCIHHEHDSRKDTRNAVAKFLYIFNSLVTTM
jgi:hypothetical protein